MWLAGAALLVFAAARLAGAIVDYSSSLSAAASYEEQLKVIEGKQKRYAEYVSQSGTLRSQAEILYREAVGNKLALVLRG